MSMADNAGIIYITAPVPCVKNYGLSAVVENEAELLLCVPADQTKRMAFQEYVMRQVERNQGM